MRLIDKALGPELNIPKCARGFVGAARARPDRLVSGSPLLKIDVKDCFRYLGTDIVLRKGSVRKVANRRLDSFRKRCSIIKILPRQQRAVGVCDAVSALWLDGCSVYNQTQIRQAASSAFLALVGKGSGGSVIRRSRAMQHALGPAPHVTHLACAMAYSCLRQLLRMFKVQRLTSLQWTQLWNDRALVFSGPVAQLMSALHWLQIEWPSPLSWKYGSRVFRFRLPDNLLLAPAPLCAHACKRDIAAILHDARSFF